MAPHAQHLRNGTKMGSLELVDTMIKDGLWDAFNGYHMGTTAENVAEEHQIAREDQDKFALRSQQRAGAAIASGFFAEEIVRVHAKDAKGKAVTVEVLAGVKAVDIVGITKGRGYSGVIKRHGFGGQRATHGVKKVPRHMGATGSLAAWRGGGRPKKGKKMPGHYGHDRVTSRNLQVVRVDVANNLLLVRGAVPGPPGGMVVIKETNKVS